MMSENSDENTVINCQSKEEYNEPHAYIHIPPIEIGKKYQRIIVPVKTIKNFDYNAYVLNAQPFKKKLFKFKNSEGLKHKCFVLHASDNLTSVESIVKSKKRFGIPKIENSLMNISDSTNTSNINQNNIHEEQYSDQNIDEQHDQNIKSAKLTRKKRKNLKKQSAEQTSNVILNKYISNINNENSNADLELLNDTINEDDFNDPLAGNMYLSSCKERANSTNLELASDTGHRVLSSISNKIFSNDSREEHNHSNCSAAINAYKIQVTHLKKMYQDAQAEALKWKAKYETIEAQNIQCTNNTNLEIRKQSDVALLEYYDILYKYDGPLVFSEESEYVQLLHGIKCKTIAYKDAFKSSKPIQMVRKLMFGIYGYDDLVNRCIQNAEPTDEMRPLCKKKNETIEREMYRFLRLNNYNVQLIKLELQDINRYYHNAISCAKLKNKREESAKNALTLLEQQASVADEL